MIKTMKMSVSPFVGSKGAVTSTSGIGFLLDFHTDLRRIFIRIFNAITAPAVPANAGPSIAS